MMGIINGIVGSMILIIFLIGIFCDWVVKKKYEKMFDTMKNKGRDKNLLIIERDYRHGYLKDRVERIKVFVEKEYYEIKICNIPLYAFEDFTISSVYFVALLGMTFTVIQVALPGTHFINQMFQIFFLSIEGLILGTSLMAVRTFLRINVLKEIFKVNLCSYLEHELELFDEAEKDEEGNLFFHKKQKENRKASKMDEVIDNSTELIGDNVHILSDYRQSEAENLELVFDERALLQVVQEILG